MGPDRSEGVVSSLERGGRWRREVEGKRYPGQHGDPTEQRKQERRGGARRMAGRRLEAKR